MKAWGLTPAQWRQLSPNDQAMMTAFEMFEGVREAYRQEWLDERRERKSKGGDEDDRRFKGMRQKYGV